MAFTRKPGLVVETVVFNGKRYNRYPESNNPAHRRYFSRTGHRLHKDVWEFHNGPVPEGFHVHHIDGDTTNNSIENLACISRKEHKAEHREELVARNKSPRQLEHLAKIRDLASQWHRSEEGRAWHREHAKTSLAKAVATPKTYPEINFQCVWCGVQAKAKSPRRRFCGTKCQTAESCFRLGKSRTEHPYHASRFRSDS